MAGELSQKELEELVVGKAQKPTVHFYEKARLHVEKSKEAGRRIYQTYVYVNERQAGITDWVAEIAQPHHIRNYPKEYQIFLQGKKDTSPRIDIIPNISPAELQELIDMRIGTIELLASAEIMPPHLKRVWNDAKVLQSVFMEQKNASSKENNEEGQAEEVPTTDRCLNIDDIGQPKLSDSHGSEERETTERLSTGRREHSHQKQVSSNWSIAL